MPKEDGFLTHFSIEKGWRQKYTQLKWLWIGVSAVAGGALGIVTWFYIPQLTVQACIFGTFLGAGAFFLFLNSLKEKSD